MTDENNINKDINTEEIGAFYSGRIRHVEERKRRVSPLTLAGIIGFCFLLIVWYAYPKGEEKYSDLDVPVIRADSAQYKSEPVEAGGMEVPHQDSTVFDALEGGKDTDAVENILPTTEEPVIQETAEPETVAAAVDEDNTVVLSAESEKAVEKAVEPVAEPVKKAPVVEKAAVKAKPAPVSVAPVKEVVMAKGGSYIQLGAFKDMNAADKEWAGLQAKYPALLGSLAKRVTPVTTAKGTLYRLQAGSVALPAAKDICVQLNAKRPGGCIIAK